MGEAFDRRCEEKPLCDTPACHGGWAAIMYPEIFEEFSKDSDGDYILTKDCGKRYFVHFYEIGAYALAKKLGFKSKDELQDWAHIMPKYWGNYDGGAIFNDAAAFGKKAGQLKLSDIADWYEGVAGRLRTAEEEEA